jgi:hypothetical protein
MEPNLNRSFSAFAIRDQNRNRKRWNVDHNSPLFMVTSLLGLYGGLTVTLRIFVLQGVHIFEVV